MTRPASALLRDVTARFSAERLPVGAPERRDTDLHPAQQRQTDILEIFAESQRHHRLVRTTIFDTLAAARWAREVARWKSRVPSTKEAARALYLVNREDPEWRARRDERYDRTKGAYRSRKADLQRRRRTSRRRARIGTVEWRRVEGKRSHAFSSGGPLSRCGVVSRELASLPEAGPSAPLCGRCRRGLR